MKVQGGSAHEFNFVKFLGYGKWYIADTVGNFADPYNERRSPRNN